METVKRSVLTRGYGGERMNRHSIEDVRAVKLFVCHKVCMHKVCMIHVLHLSTPVEYTTPTACLIVNAELWG
jgi:hypothetical protein